MKKSTRILAMLLVVFMFASVLPMNVFAATAAGATTETIDSFAHVGRQGILSAILAILER